MLVRIIISLLFFSHNCLGQFLEGVLRYDTLLVEASFVDDNRTLSSSFSIDDDGSINSSLVFHNFLNDSWQEEFVPNGFKPVKDVRPLSSLKVSENGDFISFFEWSSIEHDSVKLSILNYNVELEIYKEIFYFSDYGRFPISNFDNFNYDITDDGSRVVVLFPSSMIHGSLYVQELRVYDLAPSGSSYRLTHTYMSKHERVLSAEASVSLSSEGDVISIGYKSIPEIDAEYNSMANILVYNELSEQWIESDFYLEHAQESSKTMLYPRYTKVSGNGKRTFYAHHGSDAFDSDESGIKIFEKEMDEWLPHTDSIKAQSKGYIVPTKKSLCISRNGDMMGVIFHSSLKDTSDYLELYSIDSGSVTSLSKITFPLEGTNTFRLGDFCDLSPSGRKLLLHDGDSTILVYNLDELLDVNVLETIKDEINLFPNPVEHLLQIEAPYEQDLKKVEIFSISGERIHTTLNPQKGISVSDYPSGIYFLRIYFKNKISTKRIVKR